MVTSELVDSFLPTGITTTKKLAETAAKIALANFQWRYITLLFFNSTSLGVIDFLHLFDKSVVISTGLTQRHTQHTEQYVVFGLDIPDITYMLDWMEKHRPPFDNTGRYIVICKSDDPANCDETEAGNTFWYHKVTNVIFLKHVEDSVVLYTYHYNENKCAMSEPMRMENFDVCLSNMSECEMFPKKFQNLHGCPLIASTFEQPPYMTFLDKKRRGCDGDLLMIVATALNATLELVTPIRSDGWGAIENGMWAGSLGDVYYDLANVSITSAALTLNRFSSFQFSYNYNFIIVGWVTSPTELEPSYLKLLHPFRRMTHIAVGLVFISVIVISFLIRSKLGTEYLRPDSDSQTLVFYSWMMCMGSPMIRLPKKPFFLYIAILWIWYTFFVRTMYQAALINSLKSNIYDKNIDTVEQALEAKYKIEGGLALKDYFINYPQVYDRFVGLNASEIRKGLRMLSRGDKRLIAMNLEAVNTFLKTNIGRLHIVRQKIVVSPTAMFFKKFSPLADPINLVLQRLFESGIPDVLYKYYVDPAKKTQKVVDNKQPLRTEHYDGCYAILFIGWTVSLVYFFCEICVEARKKWYIL